MTSKYEMAARARKRKRKKKSFPDLSGDGKITQKDILIAKGVLKNGRK